MSLQEIYTHKCEDGACPVEAGPWYYLPCTKDGTGYPSGCLVKFSRVTSCL
jgi:hypothetical protein